MVIRVPSTLHSTLASVWFGFAVGPRTDLRITLKMYSTQNREATFFSRRYLFNFGHRYV